MSKASVKSSVLPVNSHINSNLEQSQSVQPDPTRGNNRNFEERLKKKLKLQEMRCTLMSNELAKLKSLLFNKKRQLRMYERRAKREEKKRRAEEKKLKDIEREFVRLREENDKMKENVDTNKPMPVTNPDHQQSNSQPKPSTSIPSTSNQPSPLVVSNALAESSNAKRNKRKKKKKKAKTNDITRVTNGAVCSTVVGKSPGVQEIADISQPGPSTGLRINEGASCSGINTTESSESSNSKVVDKQNLISDTSLISGSSKLEDLFENELMCSICHELYIKPVALSCSHIFCSFCIEQWRKKAHKCPICRTTIFEISSQTILANVVEKIVNTMDEESKNRRADVVKDRPTSFCSLFRNDGTRRGHSRSLINPWSNGHWPDEQSGDSFSDESSFIPSYSSSQIDYGWDDSSMDGYREFEFRGLNSFFDPTHIDNESEDEDSDVHEQYADAINSENSIDDSGSSQNTDDTDDSINYEDVYGESTDTDLEEEDIYEEDEEDVEEEDSYGNDSNEDEYLDGYFNEDDEEAEEDEEDEEDNDDEMNSVRWGDWEDPDSMDNESSDSIREDEDYFSDSAYYH